MLTETLFGTCSGTRFGLERQRTADNDARSDGSDRVVLAIDRRWFGNAVGFRTRTDGMVWDLRRIPLRAGVERICAPRERSDGRWLGAQRGGLEAAERVLATISALAGAA